MKLLIIKFLLFTTNKKFLTYIKKLLLNKGADPNIADKNSITPLFCAANYEYMEIVELLLNTGADPNILNNYGEIPLYWAISIWI